MKSIQKYAEDPEITKKLTQKPEKKYSKDPKIYKETDENMKKTRK